MANLLLLTVYFSGCGGSVSSPANPTSPSIAMTNKPPTSLSAGGTANISATVSNDSSNAGVDWSCAPSASCGSFSPAHSASGAMTTYTAPASAPAGGTVTITATSTSTHSATAVATVSITAASGQVGVALSTPPPASLAVNATTTISATVTGDSSNAGVDWTCTPTGTCGSFNPAHTASGASTTYTGPAAAVAAVITATATASSTAKATANVNVTAAISTGTTLGAGTYVFYVSGQDASKGAYSVAGALTLDATGNITSGKQDFASATAVTTTAGGDVITAGKLTAGTNGIGTLTVTTSNVASGVAGTETFSVVVVNTKHAVIAEFDGGATSSGTIDLQTIAPGEINGPFAFIVAGQSGTKAEEFGGLFSADGAGNLHVTVDSNTGGAISRGGSNVGTYTAADASGRGTMAFGGNNFVYYIVNPKVLRLVVVNLGEPDSGSAYAQTANTTFSNASLGTNSFVFTNASAFSSTAFYAAAGQLKTDGAGNLTSGFADMVENGHATSAAVTGTYTINGSGYGTLTLTPGNTQDVSVMGLYLVDPSINFSDPNSPADAGLGALLLDLDTKLTGNGILILSAPTTPAYTFAGNYALSTQSSTTAGEGDAVGVFTVNGTAVTGTQNLNDLFSTGQGSAIGISGTLVPDLVHAGRFTIPVAATIGGQPKTANYVVYQASSSQLVVIQVDATQFALGTLQQQH
jgi:hypothetical protein